MRRSSAAYLRRKSSAGLLPTKGFNQPKNIRFKNNFQFTLKRKSNDEITYSLESVSECKTDYFFL